VTQTSRQLALSTLQVVQRGRYADVALENALQHSSLKDLDRRLVTELVYGSIRRQRTLDALIDQLAKKKATQQPPDLRLILHLGLYQLRYLDHIPESAAVNTTVELAKQNGLTGLAGFVNGVLRQYIRLTMPKEPDGRVIDPLHLPKEVVPRLGVQYSYPDWIVQVWLEQFGAAETEKLCAALNCPPTIDLRVNKQRSSPPEVQAAMASAGVAIAPLPPLPQALRLAGSAGAIRNLPGFEQGWWSVQDGSAQLVVHLLDPQPGETVIDACAAPGGKTTHIAELMGDRGVIWACDRTPSRLKKLKENAERLRLTAIQICTADSRNLPQFVNQGDRVLVDAPCSGLGTLHRHADARWRQTPDSVQELAQLQRELLDQAATWVKANGVLVYATCTLHPAENEAVVRSFLDTHSDWQMEPPPADNPAASFATPEGWVKVLPHQQSMDGFFMVRLRRAC
jgi:16S rRNA (cytosine967-C5)-methyltransferase